MAVNHIQITNAKPRDKAYKLANADGLYLAVQANGTKLWRMNYRYLGRQKTLCFGAWPEVGIAIARQPRAGAREQIAVGLDPAAEKRSDTLARKVTADNTFKTIAEEWVTKNEREGGAPTTLDKIRWLLGIACLATTCNRRAMSRLILFNKPYGTLCQFSDEGGGPARSTLADFIAVPEVYPAGRLDRDSEGLLLLTDDGRLQARIADPRFKMPKTYLVQVEGQPDAAALTTLQRGVRLKDGLTRPALAEAIADPDLWPRDPPIRVRKSVADSWLRLTISEGRNRQVRRMTAAVGYPTLRLVRWAVGEWTLDGVAPGAWRDLPFPSTTVNPPGRR